MLLPGWFEQDWFHNFCADHAEITLLQHRIKFNGRNGGYNAKFASMIVVFSPATLGKGSGSHLNATAAAHVMKD